MSYAYFSRRADLTGCASALAAVLTQGASWTDAREWLTSYVRSHA